LVLFSFGSQAWIHNRFLKQHHSEMDERLPSSAGGVHKSSEFPSSTSRWLSELKPWLRDIVLAFFFAVLIVIFIVQPVKVEGTSMQPRLVDQERIFVNRFIYRFSEIRRGDVVVFWYPRDRSKSFIKRVMGIPGDEVEIRQGSVYVNGSKVEEPYLAPQFRDRDSLGKRIVPSDRYFVLGDHRSSSNDSRNWGFVPRELIYGKAIFCYWPISRAGPVQ
jgi:signal peptidase I